MTFLIISSTDHHFSLKNAWKVFNVLWINFQQQWYRRLLVENLQGILIFKIKLSQPNKLKTIPTLFCNFLQVISSHGNATYTVDMNSVTRTCPDWMKNEMPCKHFFAVVQHTNFSWEELPYDYRNHPLFTTHNNCQELLNGNNVVAPELTNMSR